MGPRPPLGGGFWSWGGPHYHYHYGGYNGGSGSGGSPALFTFIIIFCIILFLVIGFVAPSSNNTAVPSNTKVRQALSGAVNKTDWYQDGIGWISNRSTLISGLETFYNKTGIQPYVLFVPYSSNLWNGSTINVTAAKNYMENVYKSTFTDEAHFIFAYFQCANDSKAEMDGEFRYLSGYEADTIMDEEALSIFWGYFNTNYYNTSLSLEKMISNTFEDTAKSIMSKPTNGFDVIITILVIGGIVAVVVVIYFIMKNKAKREKEKEEYTKEILDKPLETFGKDTKDLEDKYKDKE